MGGAGDPAEEENLMHDTMPHEHAHDHAPHDHDHDHGTPHAHGTGTEQAPENVDNLILDIGADTGALIIHAAVDRDQAEIEISPAGREQARAHNIVRRREAVSGAVYAAVFPALTAGDYVVWRDAATPAGTVVVHGGQVASFRLN
jgi:ABC-type Zn2+ transport system substrate-binding protein/surface adhesin